MTPPVVVITSNSEKQLPDAFLRRCVYHHIELTPERIQEIVEARLRELPLDAPAFQEAKRLFFALREPAMGLVKRPSTSELLDWLRALQRAGLLPDVSLVKQRDLVRGCLGTLVKTEGDLPRAEDILFR